MRVLWTVCLFATLFTVRIGAAEPAPIKVVVTLFPLYDFCRQVGGDAVECSMLLPPGIEPHGFSPSPMDISRVNKSNLFIHTSDLMEPWLAGIKSNLSPSVSVVAAGEGLATVASEGHAACEHGCEHHHDGDEGAALDPHIWLDFEKAKTMVDVIARALSQVRPELTQVFSARAIAYKKQLTSLDERTRKELSACRLKTVMSGGHFAFGYYVRRYGLEHQSPYDGFSPDAEPSPAAIAELIHTMKREGQSTIFTEEMVSDRVARIISSETGARLSLLHAAHNLTPEEFDRGDTFIGIMEGNLERLTAALKTPVDATSSTPEEAKSHTVGIIIFASIVLVAMASLGSIIFNRARR